MPNVRLLIAIQRRIHSLAYHHGLMVLIAASWISLALLLAGCTANIEAMSNIYVLSLRYNSSIAPPVGANNPDDSKLEVRVNYFGVCAQRSSQTEWVCARGVSGLQSVIAGSTTDPQNITSTGVNFKDDVLFAGLLIGAMALTGIGFVGMATFPGWRRNYGIDFDTKPFPSPVTFRIVWLTLGAASLLMLVSALWQHVAAASVVAMISTTLQEGSVAGHVGAASAALVWLSFALTVVAFQGIVVTLWRINLLSDRLTDDTDDTDDIDARR